MTTLLKIKYLLYGGFTASVLQLIYLAYIERSVDLRKDELRKLKLELQEKKEEIKVNRIENKDLIFSFLFESYYEYFMKISFIEVNKLLRINSVKI